MKRPILLAICAAVVALVFVGVVWRYLDVNSQVSPPGEEKVVINEAARTLVYLPIYNALYKGYFKDEGLDVQIVTGGTPTAAFSAMLTGNADFASSDPMFVPISRQKGARTKVVAQIVARIAAWALAPNSQGSGFDLKALQGRTISTVQRPTTWYTYTANYVHALGLVDGFSVTILQNRAGSELAPFLSHRADFVVTAEPGASIAENAGAHIVYSWPQKLGDRIFTGLSTREEVIAKRRPMVLKVIRAIQRSLADLAAHPEDAAATAKIYFPGVPAPVLEHAVRHLVQDHVVPASIEITPESWRNAVDARREAGDITKDAPYSENVANDLILEALKSNK